MKKNHLTLIIQPTCAGVGSVKHRKTLSFHGRVIPCFFLMCVLLAVFGIRGSWAIFENRALRQDVASLQDSMSDVSRIAHKIAAARTEARRVRGFLGVEAGYENFNIDDRLGMGGIDAEEDAGDVSPLDPMAELEALADKRPLHVQVHSLRTELAELGSILSKMSATLKNRPTIVPVMDDDIYLTSGFGWRKSPFTGLRQFHSGVDIAGRKGAPIVATADGVVSSVGYDRLLGNYVWINHDGRFETGYAHLTKATVEKGEKVQRGQVIGLMGTTGMSTGYHLHYEVVDNGKKINPYHFILNREDLRLNASRG
ncbi:MAG: M23 family metallopeptidase [Deltaproteobacteria bacterium]|nr:M23 family metallopeptidase [Deltaproteobacteria bacterium]